MKILIIVVGLFAVAGVLAVWLLKQPTIGGHVSEAETPADPARLEADVRQLSEGFFPRNWTHPENLDAAAAWIRAELEKTGAIVSEQTWEVDGVTYRNVIASYGPDSGARVVVGAHYDAHEELPGADDNASGVAGLLELGRMLGPAQPQARVELVAFSLEEMPFFRTHQMGSAVHATSLVDSDVSVRVMLCLEMIGYFSDAKNSQTFPSSVLKSLYPNTGNFIAVVGQMGKGGMVRTVKKSFKGASDLPVRSINAPAALPGVDFSDHLSYWERGFDAVMITDTAFYRNAAYHTPDDTADRLDYERMAKVVDGTFNAVMHLAGGD